MLRVERRASSGNAGDSLLLAYDDRKKSRLRVRSQRGVEVAIVLARGQALREGDLLLADSGEVLVVRAAPEPVSEVSGANARLLACAAYHLGNRHVPLQIGVSVLRYQRDHVLDEMVRALGLTVTANDAPFEPEAGAYAGARGHGARVHGHAHDQ